MATITFRKADGTTAYMDADGSGTLIDPYRPKHNYLDGGPEWTTLHKVVNYADMTTQVAVCDAPSAGLKFVLTDLIISTDTAMSVTIKEETSGTVLAGPFYMLAFSTMQITPRGGGIKTAVAAKRIMALASVDGNVTVETFGYVEA